MVRIQGSSELLGRGKVQREFSELGSMGLASDALILICMLVIKMCLVCENSNSLQYIYTHLQYINGYILYTCNMYRNVDNNKY